MTTRFRTVEEYIAMQPEPVQMVLEKLRMTIAKAAPNAEEVISYNIPCFKLNGMLVWYAAFKEHVGFYPRASGIEAFQKELSAYKWAKGSVQFPLGKPLPWALITKIVKYRVQENNSKAIRPKKKVSKAGKRKASL